MNRFLHFPAIVLIVLYCSCVWSNAPEQKEKSLSYYVKQSKQFTQNHAYDSVIQYLELGLALHTGREDKSLLAEAYFDLGVAYSKTGRFNKGTENQLRSIEVKKAINDSAGIGSSLNIIGLNYYDLGEYETAISYFVQSMQYREALNDLTGVAWNLNNIGNAYGDAGWPDKEFNYHERALKIRESNNDSNGIAASLNNLALLHFNRGDLVTAIAYLHRILKMVDREEHKYIRANALQNLGIFYSAQGQHEKALKHALEARKLREELGDVSRLLSTMANIAATYLDLKEPEKCLAICREIIEIGQIEGIDSDLGSAYYYMAITYLDGQQYDSALHYIQKDPALIDFENQRYGVSRAVVLGRIYTEQGRYEVAIQWLEKAMAKALKTTNFSDLKSISDALYKAYKGSGKSSKALQMLELYHHYRDSVMSEDNQRALIETEYRYQYEKAAMADSISNAKATEIKNAQIAQQQAEIKAKKNQQYGLFGGLGLMCILAAVFFTQRNRISTEKERSESLLLNILPEEVAEELKAKGEAEATLIDQVTVLFTDFKGFTALSEKVTPKELVYDLHACFSEFDRICEKYGIEKIKTIGDAYMAAGGLPTPNTTHACDVINAAIEMAEVVENGKAKKIAAGLPFFEIRIGIHTGPVVAGIVGVKKFQYDIWGDTVNTASRMESSGAVGQVNISEATYKLVKDQFNFEFRGEIEAKGKGKLGMYFVSAKIEVEDANHV
jgi:adenylate cyclase